MLYFTLTLITELVTAKSCINISLIFFSDILCTLRFSYVSLNLIKNNQILNNKEVNIDLLIDFILIVFVWDKLGKYFN